MVLQVVSVAVAPASFANTFALFPTCSKCQIGDANTFWLLAIGSQCQLCYLCHWFSIWEGAAQNPQRMSVLTFPFVWKYPGTKSKDMNFLRSPVPEPTRSLRKFWSWCRVQELGSSHACVQASLWQGAEYLVELLW